MKGWHNQSYRHSLASKGIKTSIRKSFMPVYIYRESTGRKHKGNELDNEVRAMYKDKPIDHILDNPIEHYRDGDHNKKEEMEMDYINEQVKNDKKNDIREIRWTDNNDFMIMNLKRDKDGDLQSVGPNDKDDDDFDDIIKDAREAIAEKKAKKEHEENLKEMETQKEDYEKEDHHKDKDFAAKKIKLKKEERLALKFSKSGPIGTYEQAIVVGESPKILKKQLNAGIREEMEHTGDRKIAKHIALDHLTEDPHYYTKLKRAGL
jgi:hypothetical protein